MKSLCPKHRKNCLETLRQLRDICDIAATLTQRFVSDCCVTAFSGHWSTKTHQDGEPFCPADFSQFSSFLVDVRVVVACLLIFEVKLGKKAMPYPFF